MNEDFKKEYFKPLSEIGFKEYFKMKTRLFFYPLRYKWFWVFSIIFAIIALFLEHS